MMTEDETRAVIERRLDILCESTANLPHAEGLLRGLLWAMTGTDPGPYPAQDTAAICQAAGIPWHKGEDGLIHYGAR